MKQISELSPVELGQLFPIILSEPNPEWPVLFKLEKVEIENVLGSSNIVSIEHIGSTAVPNLKAKQSVDILLQVIDSVDDETIIESIRKIGYEFIPRPENPPPHMMFVKGYTPQGFKGQTFHIHVRYKGDWDEIYFRDYLINHQDIASEYAELKLTLAQIYKNDRDGYTDAKTEFVKRITDLARQNR